MLESKKYDIIEWIISIADEKVIDTIQSIKDRIESQSGKPSKQAYKFNSSTYAEIKARKVDVEQLKIEQNYKPITPVELKMIATEANIEESIEDLLVDLKELG